MNLLQHLEARPVYGDKIEPDVFNLGQYRHLRSLQVLSFSMMPEWPGLIDCLIFNLECTSMSLRFGGLL